MLSFTVGCHLSAQTVVTKSVLPILNDNYSKTYIIHEKTICGGNVISGYSDPKLGGKPSSKTPDVNICAKTCDENPYCKAFTIDKFQNCILKTAQNGTIDCKTIARSVINNQYQFDRNDARSEPIPVMTGTNADLYTLQNNVCYDSRANLDANQLKLNMNIDNCSAECEKNDYCKGFTYNILNKQCVLKDMKISECPSSSKPRGSDGVFQFDRKQVKAEPIPVITGTNADLYTLQNNVCYDSRANLDVNPQRLNSTIDNCSEECEKNTYCKGFTYNIFNKQCFLKDMKINECPSNSKPRGSDGVFHFDKVTVPVAAAETLAAPVAPAAPTAPTAPTTAIIPETPVQGGFAIEWSSDWKCETKSYTDSLDKTILANLVKLSCGNRYDAGILGNPIEFKFNNRVIDTEYVSIIKCPSNLSDTVGYIFNCLNLDPTKEGINSGFNPTNYCSKTNNAWPCKGATKP